MARITIDGVDYEVREGDNLLAAALSHRLDLPYFCWHPTLGSVGACRQCAVKQYKDSNDTRGKLVMACMTAVSDGARFTLNDKESRAFRASVIEWLMLNHPHDCPVCDEGGECHLQDMTVMTGHVYRRTRFPKRTYANQDLGPFVAHEMNRCIACYRCVRFYRDYAGGTDLHAFASKNHVYFGRHSDGVLESPFSGNLVEVCPTGVFTDKTLARHYTRKWDRQSAPSVCPHCGVGCNTLASERYGTLRRIENRYHRAINGHFLCDRGRFGYEFVNLAERITVPQVRARGGAWQAVDADAVVDHLAKALEGKRLIGIGSPRATLESNLALRRLVGGENFCRGFGAQEERRAMATLALLRRFGSLSLREVEACDAVIVIGEEVEATNPRLALALRQSVRVAARDHAAELGVPSWQDASVRDATPQLRSPLFVLSPTPSALDAVATGALRLAPAEIATRVRRLADALRGEPAAGDAPDPMVEALRAAQRPAVIVGAVAGDAGIVGAAEDLLAALQQAGKQVGLVVTAAEANTVGLALMAGMTLEQLPTGAEVAWLILENDLARRLPADPLRQMAAACGCIVVADSLPTPTTAMADVILPAATFAERDGIYVNHEGRAQRAVRVFPSPGEVRESWRWIGLIAAALDRGEPWTDFGALLRAVGSDLPALAPAVESLTLPLPPNWRIARESHRYSGRTAQCADQTLREPPPPADRDSPYSFSMEGYGGPVAQPLAPRYWAPGWNSPQAVNFYLPASASGVRLIAGTDASARVAQESIEDSAWTAVALPVIFGSDELSARAPAVATLVPSSYAALHPEDAAALGVAAGDTIEIAGGEGRWQLPVRLAPVARGVVAITLIESYVAMPLPMAVSVRRAT